MQRSMIVILMATVGLWSSACVASRKYVRNEVQTSSDQLSSRIDTNQGAIGEVQDGVKRTNDNVTAVDNRVSALDSKTGQATGELKGDVQSLNQKTDAVQATANQASSQVVTLDEKFQNRNQFSVASAKSVLFKFDSSKLDPKYQSDLDSAAAFLASNPNAIVVLEGHTDSKGDPEYNFKLGERRVDSVKRYLAVEKAVPVYRLHDVSMGKEHPVAANDSKDGRQQNRAVTLTILVPADSKAGASNGQQQQQQQQ